MNPQLKLKIIKRMLLTTLLAVLILGLGIKFQHVFSMAQLLSCIGIILVSGLTIVDLLED